MLPFNRLLSFLIAVPRHLPHFMLFVAIAFLSESALAQKKDSVSRCNALAEAPSDPDKTTKGVYTKQIDTQAALAACKAAVEAEPENGKLWYQYGRVLRKDKQDAAALKAFGKGTEYQSPLATYAVGRAYSTGTLGVKRNGSEAFKYYLASAKLDFRIGQHATGLFYERGRGIDQNFDQAAQWYLKAAYQGFARAMYDIGRLYRDGKGVKQDLPQALAWFRQAAATGYQPAEKALAEAMSSTMEKQAGQGTETARNPETRSAQNAAPKTVQNSATRDTTTGSTALATTPSSTTTDDDATGVFMEILDMIAGTGFLGLLIILVVLIALIGYFVPFRLWITAWASGAYVGLLTLVAMRLRRVPPHGIVKARISSVKAGLNIPLDELESHFLAGGNVVDVVNAIISADKANIELTFNKAAAIDLAGRNVLDAVQMSVLPKVIQTPRNAAVAQDGIQLIAVARVTVRTNLDRLVGGAGEETVLARVGEGMVSAIGSASNHKDVLEKPDSISKRILSNGLDAGTAYEILSIDIADIDVGKNIGAALQIEQANADKQIAQAKAEERRAMAVALEQEMRAVVVEAESEVPQAMADAFRKGHILSAEQPA